MSTKLLILSVYILMCCCEVVVAQSPVQNCQGAIPICSNSFSQINAYSGVGTQNELNASNQGCLTTGENNSIWYIFTTSTAGNVVFTLTPNVTSDYDFAIWDLTDKSCAAIGAGLAPIRCNYASLANSTAGGLTGLSMAAPNPSVGAGGGSFSSGIAASAGQTFVLLVNNASGNASGYNLSFIGSTASISDNTTPVFKADTLPSGCAAPSSIKLLLSEPVKCNTLQVNGSDFQLSPPSSAISSASSVSCASGSDFTNLITVNFSSSLAPGTYTLSVKVGTDGNTLIDNCNNAMPVGTQRVFTVLPSIAATAAVQFGCAGTPTGVITAGVVGGQGPYQYKLNNGVFAATNVFSGLSAGTYTITVRDINNCQDDTIVTLTPSPPVIINAAVVSNITCFGSNNGTVTITASGGNPPLTYSVNMNPFQPSNTITNLGPGNYVVNAKDANGCTSTSIIFVSSPGQILVNSLIVTNTTCGTNNGSIVISAFGGTPPLNYSLNNGGFQSSGNYTGLASGSYTISIKDNNNCTKDTIINVQSLGGVSVTSVSVVQPSCVGNTGSITINGSGGVSPYTYSINGVTYVASNNFGSLASGSYTVTIKDANNCTATSVVSLSSPANLYYASATIVNPTCVGSNGSITVAGGGGAAPYTYAIGAGPYSGSGNFGSLGAGTYVIHLQDNNNCIHDTIISLVVSALPVVNTISIVNPSCSFPSAGAITVYASGGVASLTYSLNGAPYQPGNFYTGLTAGVYTIVVRDANNCTSSSVASLNSSNTLGFSSFVKTNVGCGGAPLGTISAVASNGNSPYQYSLNGAPYQASGNYTGLSAGTYTVIARDASNCTVSSITTITSSAIVSITSLSITNSTCYSPGNGTISISGTVSASPISYYLNFSNGNSTGNFTNIGPGTYTVSVYDANGCKRDTLVTITSPPPLYYTNVNIVMPPCFGGVGSISLVGAGGTPGYSYAIGIGSYGPTSSWNNLNAGTYIIHLRDANNCIRDTIINLIQPPPIQISGMTILNASCNLAPTGSITINGNGGVLPYSYSLNLGTYGPSNSFTNLAAGTYTVRIRDANNCVKDTVVTLNNNGNFYITSISFNMPSCFGLSNGSINFGVSGGVAPYQYAINAGSYGGSSTFNGLSAGFYTLHAIDNSGCIRDSVVYLSQPIQVGFSSINLTPALCYNTNTGSASVQGTGGTPSYQYRIDNGPFIASGSFVNLSPGTHTLTVRDANNCTKDTVVTISEPLPVGFANVTVIPPGCFSNTGVISVGGSGGVSPYTFAINNGPYSSNGGFPNLPIGSYTVYVQDANNCIYDTVITISLQPFVIVTSLTYTAYLCPGATNGSIAVSATSIYFPVTYALNAGTPQLSGNFSGLSAGIYTLHIEDQLGCYTDTIVTIQNAPPIQISSTMLQSPLCHNSSDGTITIFASGGLGTLRYSVNNSPYSLSNVFNNLSAGSYTLRVRDSINCIKDTIVVLTAPPSIGFSSVLLNGPFCTTATNGSISIVATGGVGPYLYAINNSLFTTANTFTNLIQGAYTIYVQDMNGCIYDTVVQLNALPYMNFTNVQVQNVSCKFGNDGSISLVATLGFAPYQYSINSIPNGTSGVFSNLGIGTYTIQVTDNIGCTKDTIITITEPLFPLKVLPLSMQPNICKGDSAGSLTVSAIGGNPPYTYSLDGVNFQASPTFTALPAAIYTITVRDLSNCIHDTTMQVEEPLTSVQLVNIGTKHTSCLDVNDGSLLITTQYGVPPFQFFLNGNAVGADTFYNNLSPGEYIIVVIDSVGCTSTGKYFINPSERKPYIIVDSVKHVLCAGDKDAYISWHAIDCFPPYRYFFNGTAYGATAEATGITNGSYYIQVLDTIGCYNDTLVHIVPGNIIEVDVTVTDASCTGLGDDGKAIANVLGGVAPFSYWWSITSSQSPQVSRLPYGKHWAYVKDALGCQDSTEFEVAFDPCCKVSLPNAFTPNGDYVNDVFRIISYGQIELVSMEIYNRWGNLVFKTSDIMQGWDGTYLGKDADLATYFYQIRYKCPLSNEILLLKGDVILLR